MRKPSKPAFPSCHGQPVESMDPSVEFCEDCAHLKTCIPAMIANGYKPCGVQERALEALAEMEAKMGIATNNQLGECK